MYIYIYIHTYVYVNATLYFTELLKLARMKQCGHVGEWKAGKHYEYRRDVGVDGGMAK